MAWGPTNDELVEMKPFFEKAKNELKKETSYSFSVVRKLIKNKKLTDSEKQHLQMIYALAKIYVFRY